MQQREPSRVGEAKKTYAHRCARRVGTHRGGAKGKGIEKQQHHARTPQLDSVMKFGVYASATVKAVDKAGKNSNICAVFICPTHHPPGGAADLS